MRNQLRFAVSARDAARSGFLYVLDAKEGKLIAANPYGKVNWANGIDKETGRLWFLSSRKMSIIRRAISPAIAWSAMGWPPEPDVSTR